MFQKEKKKKVKYRVAADSDRQQTEHTPHRYFRCRSVYNLISKCLKPPMDKKKWLKQVRFNERGNRALQNECENGDYDNNQKIYASMARMSDNDNISSRDFGDS